MSPKFNFLWKWLLLSIGLRCPPKSKRYKAMGVASNVLESGNFNNVSKLAMVNRLIGIGLIKGLSFQKNKQ